MFHSYRGEESSDHREVSQGWTSRLIRVEGLDRSPIDVYYDALDDDVMLLGGARYREWFLNDEVAEQQCLDDLDRIVDDLAANLLVADSSPRRRAPTAAVALSTIALVVGVLIGRVFRRQ